MGVITTTKSKNEPGAIGPITIMGLPVYTPTPKGRTFGVGGPERKTGPERPEAKKGGCSFYHNAL